MPPHLVYTPVSVEFVRDEMSRLCTVHRVHIRGCTSRRMTQQQISDSSPSARDGLRSDTEARWRREYVVVIRSVAKHMDW